MNILIGILIGVAFIAFVFFIAWRIAKNGNKDYDEDENESGTQELFYHGVENELL